MVEFYVDWLEGSSLVCGYEGLNVKYIVLNCQLIMNLTEHFTGALCLSSLTTALLYNQVGSSESD